MSKFLEPPPTPLDLTFVLFGTHVRVSVWFWVLPAVVSFHFAAFFGMSYFVVTIYCFFLSVLLHEFGHVIAGRWFGQNGCIVLNGLGGVAVGCADAFERWQRIVVYAAGPAIQVLAAGVLWGTDQLFMQGFSQVKMEYPLVFHALKALIWISLVLAVFNMLPLYPALDGFRICREFIGYFTQARRVPWEQDPNWWKRGVDRSDYAGPPDPVLRGTYSNRLPLLILVGVTAVVLGWHALRDMRIATATDLMEEFKKDADGAMQKYGRRRISFKAVLQKPPWDKSPYQHGGGKEILVHFATDNPGEWLFCSLPYDKTLELKDGWLYRVSGEIYHFESQGNLFLLNCSVRLIGEAATAQ